MVKGKPLGDVATHGGAHQVDFAKLQVVDETEEIFGKERNRIVLLAGRTFGFSEPPKINPNDPIMGGKSFGLARPVFSAPSEAVDENDWLSSALVFIMDADAVDLDYRHSFLLDIRSSYIAKSTFRKLTTEPCRAVLRAHGAIA
jgi:hypothetical protein